MKLYCCNDNDTQLHSMADPIALTEFFNYCDTDHNGLISVTEIRTACGVDINGDGTIDSAEIDIGSAPWLAVLSTQDLNGDQQISLSELLAYNHITL